MAHQAGFDNVVASLGTALTPGQVALLTRYAERIVLAYDVDAAGEKAGTLGVTALADLIRQLQADASGVKLEDVRVARLPAGKDPDEVVRETPDAWPTIIGAAKPLVEYLIGHHAERFDLKTLDRADRVRRRGHAVHPRHRRPAPARRGAPGGPARVGRRGARPSPGPRAPVRGDRPGSGRRPPVAHQRGLGAVVAGRAAGRDILRGITPVEAELLRLLLFVPELQLRVVDELGPDQLPSTLARELYRAIVLQRASDDQGIHPPFDRDALLLTLDDETRSLAQALYAVGPDPGGSTPPNEVDRLLIDLEIDQIRDLATTTKPPSSRPSATVTPRRSPAHGQGPSDQRNTPVARPTSRPDPAVRRTSEVTLVR